jgi:hypothetical protein
LVFIHLEELVLIPSIKVLIAMVARQRAGDVNVIIGAADFVCGAFDFATDAGQVFDEFHFDFDVDPWSAVLGAKHKMQDHVR